MLGLDNPLHILMVLVVVLMVFGAKRLPEMGKGLGEGLSGFRKAMSGDQPSAASLTPAPAAPKAASLASDVEPAAAETASAPAAPVTV
jgi:sec-independent protein translocase protein TatA